MSLYDVRKLRSAVSMIKRIMSRNYLTERELLEKHTL